MKDIPINFLKPDIYTAYFYGFFWGDGYLHKKGAVRIVISDKDAKNLKRILKRVAKFTCYKHGKKNLTRFDYCSMNLVKFMTDLDFTKKSFVSPTKVLNLIPKEFHYMFWKGLFDADGCWYFRDKPYKGKKFTARSFHVVSSYDYDWSDYIDLLSSLGISYHITRSSHKCGQFSYVKTTHRFCLTKLFNYIYQDNLHIGYSRKYKKALQCRTDKVKIDRLKIIQFYNEDLSYRKIANLCQCSVSTVGKVIRSHLTTSV